MSSEQYKDVWLVTRISGGEYQDLVCKNKSIQDAYIDKSREDLFSITKIYREEEYEIKLSLKTEEWMEKFPVNPIFSEKEISDGNRSIGTSPLEL